MFGMGAHTGEHHHIDDHTHGNRVQIRRLSVTDPRSPSAYRVPSPLVLGQSGDNAAPLSLPRITLPHAAPHAHPRRRYLLARSHKARCWREQQVWASLGTIWRTTGLGGIASACELCSCFARQQEKICWHPGVALAVAVMPDELPRVMKDTVRRCSSHLSACALVI